MSSQIQKVAVVIGTSQGLGAGIVDGYRKVGYAGRYGPALVGSRG